MRCKICNQLKDRPYRVYDESGKIIMGCISKFHDGEIITPSESASWQNRKEVKKIRGKL